MTHLVHITIGTGSTKSGTSWWLPIQPMEKAKSSWIGGLLSWQRLTKRWPWLKVLAKFSFVQKLVPKFHPFIFLGSVLPHMYPVTTLLMVLNKTVANKVEIYLRRLHTICYSTTLKKRTLNWTPKLVTNVCILVLYMHTLCQQAMGIIHHLKSH